MRFIRHCLTKALYTLGRFAWRFNAKKLSYTLSGWAFKISHEPKTYR